jgi:cell division septum initiation protein DivIVA
MLYGGDRSMTTTETTQGVESTNDAGSSDAIVASANEEAKQILATSRYEAFRLVTEARTEAETILEEARAEAAGMVKAAEITAQSKIDAADAHAVEIVQAAEERSAAIAEAASDLVPEADTDTDALEAEHRELSERVSSLRILADQLEQRFAALAASTPDGSPGTDAPQANADTTLDYSPSVAPTPANPIPEALPAEEDAERGSFYSRRSANLPRIGEAGGQSALDMTRSIRARLESD